MPAIPHAPLIARPQLRTRGAWAVLMPVLAAGCTGSATVHVVPYARTDFMPGEPLIQSIAADEACYWVGQDGQLNIAMRYRSPSILGKAFDSQWLMSLVLDGLPAGRQRLYTLQSSAIRMVQSAGGEHRRSRSWTGIAVIDAPRNGTLKGRFHAIVSQQRFAVLGGWTPPIYQAPRLVVAGEFEAVLDPTRGAEILACSEADDFGRPPPRPKKPAVSSHPARASRPAAPSRPATPSRPAETTTAVGP